MLEVCFVTIYFVLKINLKQASMLAQNVLHLNLKRAPFRLQYKLNSRSLNVA